ncbi:MAG: peroxide stress protein YaaA [Gammaproteobacteria bacterium]|jgi:cytoplasmic iron level regulating protein YaaA (DUF328/UPF0246 family)|nr:peroxide stress protein YaaA [Gammaproteobacteria bacterium]
MLAILSPAKTLDYETPLTISKSTQPDFNNESKELISTLRKFAPAEISSLMKISDNLAELNHRRYAEWQSAANTGNARPAIFAFKGDVYQGLDAQTLAARDVNFAQKHLRVLSGLHGLLRPLDLIQPYRLEMGTRLTTRRGSNLYQFWGDKITDSINEALAQQTSKVLVNLASNEYYQVIQPERIEGRILTINFKELRDGKYRFVSFSAKKARGLMARYMIDNRIIRPNQLRQFDVDNYTFNEALSSDDEWIFTR